MIIDTNALSAFAAGNLRVRELIEANAGPYLPVIVVGEYRFGLMGARDRDRRLAWLVELTKHWPVLDVSAETAVRYAEIRQSLKERARPIPMNDTWIAAFARQHKLPVLSNDGHFDAVSEIHRIGF